MDNSNITKFQSRGSHNSNSNQEPAEAFLNIIYTLKDGSEKKVIGVPLRFNSKIGRSFLKAFNKKEDRVYKLTGTINLNDPDEEFDI